MSEQNESPAGRRTLAGLAASGGALFYVALALALTLLAVGLFIARFV